jgi:predicted TIM-barrel fold metal-dependent hydrolase
MADLDFVDTHVHFWNLLDPVLRYEWLAPDTGDDPDLGNYDAIKSQRYMPEDFVGETRFANVSKVVHVQAAIGTPDPVDETVWLQRLADRLGLPHGIVAYADLGAPDAESILGRHAEHANLCGIRDLRYDGYLTDEAWRRGYAVLECYGLVCCDDPHVEAMADAAELARRFSGITYCVDHAGFPRRRDSEYFAEWRRGMRAIASVENTVVKISGLGMADHRWTVDSLRPWVLECIDAWGPTRAFFGTNWPVDRLYSSYRDVVDAYREIVADFTADEQAALFSVNAERVFRLGRDGSGGSA